MGCGVTCIRLTVAVVVTVLFLFKPTRCTSLSNQMVVNNITTSLLLGDSEGDIKNYASNIINSEDAEVRRYNYAEISLQSQTSIVGRYTHQCGGSLIAVDIILTAAHCVRLIDKVLVDVYNLYFDDSVSTTYSVLNTSHHPLYEAETYRYDFAVVHLGRKVNSTITPIRLNSNSSIPNETYNLTVLGFGALQPTKRNTTSLYPETMQMGIVQYMSNAQCEGTVVDNAALYTNEIFDEMLCALGKGVDACAGDSGGPLLIRGFSESFDLQVGIVSWGRGCAVYPGVYSRISSGYDWIRKQVCYHSADPPSYMGCTRGERNPVYTTITIDDSKGKDNEDILAAPSVSQSTTAPVRPLSNTQKPATTIPGPVSPPVTLAPQISPNNYNLISTRPTNAPYVTTIPQPSANPTFKPTIRRPNVTETYKPSVGSVAVTAELQPVGSGVDDAFVNTITSTASTTRANGIIIYLDIVGFGMILLFYNF